MTGGRGGDALVSQFRLHAIQIPRVWVTKPITVKHNVSLQCSLYKLKRCSKKECCKQCRYVKFKGTMTKWPVQNPTRWTTQKQTLRKNYFCVFQTSIFFIFFFIYNFYNDYSKKCWVTALVWSMIFIVGLNQFSPIAKPTLT